MEKFHFDPERHIYTLDGKKIPSVTKIISPLYDFSKVPADVLEKARKFGVAVHRTVQLYLLEMLKVRSLDPALMGCLRGFIACRDDNPEIFAENPTVEKPGYHKILKYAGTPDLDFPSSVVDLKSRKVNLLTDEIQLIAYDNMTGDGKRDHYVLELYPDESYKLIKINPSKARRNQSWSRFRFLLDHLKNQQEIERWS